MLSAALAPQAAPEAPSPVPAADLATVARGAGRGHLDAGIAAFKKRRFTAARAEFEKAEAADPQSAAAAFYLGYTFYKLGEPSRRMNENKEKARELFAKAFSLDPAFRPAWGR